jgi:pseudaminic acid cytidylyltransferase
MTNLVIIPAREGSKRILNKNIKSFLGEPIINYPIRIAMQSGCFDEIMVSTNSSDIANIALSAGAKVPFMRSNKNSNDHATTADVIKEVLEEYSKKGKSFDQICCLYPTSVFISTTLINKASLLLSHEETDGVVTVAPYSQAIERSLLIQNNHLYFNNPELRNTRTQDLETKYYDAAQMYFLKTKAFYKEYTVFVSKSTPLILTSMVQDIDTKEDWELAELKYQMMIKNNTKA